MYIFIIFTKGEFNDVKVEQDDVCIMVTASITGSVGALPPLVANAVESSTTASAATQTFKPLNEVSSTKYSTAFIEKYSNAKVMSMNTKDNKPTTVHIGNTNKVSMKVKSVSNFAVGDIVTVYDMFNKADCGCCQEQSRCCPFGSVLQSVYNNKYFSYVCQKYGVYLQDGKTYTLTVKFQNMETRKVFANYRLKFDYFANRLQ